MSSNGIFSSAEIAEMGQEEILRLTPEDFRGDMDQRTLQRILEKCGALWLHSSDPAAPHAELPSRECSNGFVDVSCVLQYPNLCELLARLLVRKLRANYFRGVRWVATSDEAAAPLASAVADCISLTKEGPKSTRVWESSIPIQPDEPVLQVEGEVITLDALERTRRSIREENPDGVTFASAVLTVVHHPTFHWLEGGSLVAFLFRVDIETWEQEECPLCKAGSERLRLGQDWAKLTRRA